MIVLQIGDIHCDKKNLKRLTSLKERLRHDLLAVHGDVECGEDLLNLVEEIGGEILFVPGNMDDEYVARLYSEKGYNIDGEIREIKDYIFIGLGGLDLDLSLRKINEKILRIDFSKTIVLSHYPPYNTKTDVAWNRRHIGSQRLRDFVERFQPKIFLHGHVHESPGIDFLGRTLVVNPGPLKNGRLAIIYPDENKAELLRLEDIK